MRRLPAGFGELERLGAPEPPATAWFSEYWASRVCVFVEGGTYRGRRYEPFLVHTDAEWAGQPFRLLDWERDFLRALFGWRLRKGDDAPRLFTRFWLEVGKKNGKTELVAAITAVLLYLVRPLRGEIMNFAADREQAGVLFKALKFMVARSPVLLGQTHINKYDLFVPETWGVAKVMSAEAYTKHGYNLMAVMIDEVHAHPNRDLIDTLEGAVAAREDPLVGFLTTAGSDVNSIGYEKHDYARRVRAGLVRDPRLLPVIFSAEALESKEDPLWWTRPAALRAANPSMPTTPKLGFLQQELREALEIPAKENKFKRLHLNIWTQQADRVIPMHLWDACGNAAPLADLEGREAWGGLDLSRTTDMSAFVLAIPGADGEVHVLPLFWLPADKLGRLERHDRLPYRQWIKAGWLEITPGPIVDYDYIERAIERQAERLAIQDIGYDPKFAAQLVRHLEERQGLTCTAVKQGYAGMAGPMAELLRMLEDGRLAHGGHPVLRAHAEHLAARVGPDNDMRPDKANSGGRIDGVVALLMALNRWLEGEPDEKDLGGLRVYTV